MKKLVCLAHSPCSPSDQPWSLKAHTIVLSRRLSAPNTWPLLSASSTWPTLSSAYDIAAKYARRNL